MLLRCPKADARLAFPVFSCALIKIPPRLCRPFRPTQQLRRLWGRFFMAQEQGGSGCASFRRKNARLFGSAPCGRTDQNVLSVCPERLSNLFARAGMMDVMAASAMVRTLRSSLRSVSPSPQKRAASDRKTALFIKIQLCGKYFWDAESKPAASLADASEKQAGGASPSFFGKPGVCRSRRTAPAAARNRGKELADRSLPCLKSFLSSS